MQEPQQMKSAQWKNRLSLMRTLTKMRASKNLHLKVEEALRSSLDKELEAEKIIQILNRNEKEGEMLEELNTEET